MTEEYLAPGPTREEVDRISGAAVLEFGTDWCGYCRSAGIIVQRALAENPDILHLKVEDGPGRRLGRSFKIKLWPTLIFLKDGKELARAVRPTDVDELRSCMQVLLDASTDPTAEGF